jgi:hypothetical protein
MSKPGSRTNQCEECRWLYPFTYLAPLITSKGRTGDVCGICALVLSNRALGIERTEFTGRMAEHLRLMALNWRRRHPDLKPKEAADAQAPVPDQKT